MRSISEDTMPPTVSDARLGIEITRRCNSACLHCFAGAGQEREAEISIGALNAIVAEGARAGFRHLHITGGEPLIHPGLFELLGIAKGHGYETILLNTNGRLLDKSTSRRLAKFPELTASLSLEINEDLHDRLRGRGTHREVIKGLEQGLEAGLPIIVYTLVCQSSLEALPRFVEELYVRFPEIQFLTLNRLLQPAVQFDLKHEFLTPEHFLSLARIISLMNAMGRTVMLMNDPLINVVAALRALPALPASHSLERPGDLMVLADMALTPCHTSGSTCGVYHANSVASLWSNERYLRAIAPDTLSCPTCRHFVVCRSNGLDRPARGPAVPQATHFCQDVLDLIANAPN